LRNQKKDKTSPFAKMALEWERSRWEGYEADFGETWSTSWRPMPKKVQITNRRRATNELIIPFHSGVMISWCHSFVQGLLRSESFKSMDNRLPE